MRADLSVIVTSYNKPPDQIMECMDSIKEQTVTPKEVILVDDCSDDPRAHAYAVSIMLPKNVGVAKARDIGVKMSSGRLLLFVDADDKLAPDFIEQCGRLINNVDITYPNVLQFGAIEKPKLVDSPKEITPQYIIGKRCGLVVTSMMHRHVYEKLEGFRELPIYEDWDFWVRAVFNGYTFARANTLLYYRQNLKSRNHLSQEQKTEVHRKFTAPFEVRGKKLVKKETDGKEKVKAG
jgi:glycosyltransferase involved in cell wall biosynthesis